MLLCTTVCGEDVRMMRNQNSSQPPTSSPSLLVWLHKRRLRQMCEINRWHMWMFSLIYTPPLNLITRKWHELRRFHTASHKHLSCHAGLFSNPRGCCLVSAIEMAREKQGMRRLTFRFPEGPANVPSLSLSVVGCFTVTLLVKWPVMGGGIYSFLSAGWL